MHGFCLSLHKLLVAKSTNSARSWKKTISKNTCWGAWGKFHPYNVISLVKSFRAVPTGGRHVAAGREEEEVVAVARPLMSAQAGKSRGTGVAAASHPPLSCLLFPGTAGRVRACSQRQAAVVRAGGRDRDRGPAPRSPGARGSGGAARRAWGRGEGRVWGCRGRLEFVWTPLGFAWSPRGELRCGFELGGARRGGWQRV